MGEGTASDAAAMRALGADMARVLKAGDVVLLTGPLGAGKTTWVQGLAEGLGVRGPVTSPTFVIAREHPSLGIGPALVHVDAYRVGNTFEFDDLDLDRTVDEAVTVVEWGEGTAERLAASYLWVSIARAESTDVDGAGGDRLVRWQGHGERWTDGDNTSVSRRA